MCRYHDHVQGQKGLLKGVVVENNFFKLSYRLFEISKKNSANLFPRSAIYLQFFFARTTIIILPFV